MHIDIHADLHIHICISRYICMFISTYMHGHLYPMTLPLIGSKIGILRFRLLKDKGLLLMGLHCGVALKHRYKFEGSPE